MANTNQSALGDGNIQAGRDANITIATQKPVYTENLIECPICRSPTSYMARACPSCGHNVYEHLLLIYELKKEKGYSISLFVMMIPVILFLLYNILGSSYFQQYPILLSLPAIAIAFMMCIMYLRYRNVCAELHRLEQLARGRA